MRPLSICILLALGSANLDAAGFQLQERSTVGLGRAFSGEAAIGDDASVVASNPAAMLLVPGDSAISVGATGIFTDVNVRGTFTPTGSPSGIPAIANDITADSYIPYLYLTKRINDRLSLGFGSFTTFGLQTNYPTGFTARSLADVGKIKTINLNPSIAFRLNEHWSIGAGFNALYADGTLNSTLPNTLPTLDLSGDDWGYGFNLGLLYEINERTRFGIHYRSNIDLNITGRAISVIPPLNGPAELDVRLPDTFELSAYHELNDCWAIHADIVWTGWSSFDELAPRIIGSPVQPPATPQYYNDVWRFAIGTTWKANQRLTLRSGIAWDQSPVDNTYRTLRIPDSNRLWLSLGMSYQLNPCWSIDTAYTHVFADRAAINETGPSGNFYGAAEGGANLLSLGLSGRF